MKNLLVKVAGLFALFPSLAFCMEQKSLSDSQAIINAIPLLDIEDANDTAVRYSLQYSYPKQVLQQQDAASSLGFSVTIATQKVTGELGLRACLENAITRTPQSNNIRRFLQFADSITPKCVAQKKSKVIQELKLLFQDNLIWNCLSRGISMDSSLTFTGVTAKYQDMKIEYFGSNRYFSPTNGTWMRIGLKGKKQQKAANYYALVHYEPDTAECSIVLVQQSRYLLISHAQNYSHYQIYEVIYNELQKDGLAWKNVYAYNASKQPSFEGIIKEMAENWATVLPDWTTMNTRVLAVIAYLHNFQLQQAANALQQNPTALPDTILGTRVSHWGSSIFMLNNVKSSLEMGFTTLANDGIPRIFIVLKRGFYGLNMNNVAMAGPWLDFRSGDADIKSIKCPDASLFTAVKELVWYFIKWISGSRIEIERIILGENGLQFVVRGGSAFTFPVCARSELPLAVVQLNEDAAFYQCIHERDNKSQPFFVAVRKNTNEYAFQMYKASAPVANGFQELHDKPMDISKGTRLFKLADFTKAQFVQAISEQQLFDVPEPFFQCLWKNVEPLVKSTATKMVFSSVDQLLFKIHCAGFNVMLFNNAMGLIFVPEQQQSLIFAFESIEKILGIAPTHLVYADGLLRSAAAVPEDKHVIALKNTPIDAILQWLAAIPLEVDEQSATMTSFFDSTVGKDTAKKILIVRKHFPRLLTMRSAKVMHDALRNACVDFESDIKRPLPFAFELAKITSTAAFLDGAIIEITINEVCRFYLVDSDTFGDTHSFGSFFDDFPHVMLASNGTYSMLGKMADFDFGVTFKEFYETFKHATMNHKGYRADSLSSWSSLVQLKNTMATDMPLTSAELGGASALQLHLMLKAKEFQNFAKFRLSFGKWSTIFNEFPAKRYALAALMKEQFVQNLIKEQMVGDVLDLLASPFCSEFFPHLDVQISRSKAKTAEISNKNEIFQLLKDGKCIFFVISNEYAAKSLYFDVQRAIVHHSEAVSALNDKQQMIIELPVTLEVFSKTILSLFDTVATTQIFPTFDLYAANWSTTGEKACLFLPNEECEFFGKLLSVAVPSHKFLSAPVETLEDFSRTIAVALDINCKRFLNFQIINLYFGGWYSLVERKIDAETHKFTAEDSYRSIIFKTIDGKIKKIYICDVESTKYRQITAADIEDASKKRSFYTVLKDVCAKATAEMAAFNGNAITVAFTQAAQNADAAVERFGWLFADVLLHEMRQEKNGDFSIERLQLLTPNKFRTNLVLAMQKTGLAIHPQKIIYVYEILNARTLLNCSLTFERNDDYALKLTPKSAVPFMRPFVYTLKAAGPFTLDAFLKDVFDGFIAHYYGVPSVAFTAAPLSAAFAAAFAPNQNLLAWSHDVLHPIDPNDTVALLEKMSINLRNIMFFMSLILKKTNIVPFGATEKNLVLQAFQYSLEKIVTCDFVYGEKAYQLKLVCGNERPFGGLQMHVQPNASFSASEFFDNVKAIIESSSSQKRTYGMR